ncbi:MDR family MFS transporter [Umezawaea tangerina]|uniref:EmrB/QacA subfamily drug resistance transporter n=1 Tax=Umezawaea tangerina TaxID=84725 RepID=A0A2T0SN17_9PSEU|nr:MDR family MFS transporter [Umezawaea tangerina]PRY34809.1 EmrB/QacA subfamily drug resistance transporter [Umezawaea tangerina]
MATGRLKPTSVVTVVFVATMFVSILDATIVNVAVPRISVDFGVSPVDARTAVVGYLVALAVVIPPSGWFSDRFGAKRVLLTALAVFTVASALCGVAQDLTQLTAFRVLQGLGGGMLVPIGMAMLFRVFPAEERMRVSRITVGPAAVAPALGPVLGGLLVDNLSWRFVFLVNVPICLGVLVFGLLFLTERREPPAGRFDAAGFALSCSGVALFVYALTEGATAGWTSPVVVATGLVGAALLVLLVVVELRVPEPMLDLRLFGDRVFRTVNVVTVLAVAAFLGSLFVFPLLYQNAIGASASQTGLIGFPEAIGVMVGSQFATHVHRRLGARGHIAAALLAVAVGMVLLGLVNRSTDPWATRAIMFYLGVGMGNVLSATRASAFATLPPAKTGMASALFNTSGQVGSAVGVAVLGGVLAAVGTTTASGEPNFTAYHAAFFVAAALMVVGAACALAIRDRDLAPEPHTVGASGA